MGSLLLRLGRWIERHGAIIAFYILTIGIVIALALQSYAIHQLSVASKERRYISATGLYFSCVDSQQLWDGQPELVKFFADELGASPERKQLALDHLYAKIGKRPDCIAPVKER